MRPSDPLINHMDAAAWLPAVKHNCSVADVEIHVETVNITSVKSVVFVRQSTRHMVNSSH